MAISIQTLYLILSRSTFLSQYSHKSSWEWSNKFFTTGFGNVLPFLHADPLNSVRLGGERWWTAIFRFLQRCSIGFKSGLWLCHSRTFTELFWNHSFVILAVCLGLLACWKVNVRPILRSWTLWKRFLSRISMYLVAFIFFSIATSRPVPAAEKHPHSMMLPPRCFTWWMVLGRWGAVPGGE